jgi:hypothetical protein
LGILKGLLSPALTLQALVTNCICSRARPRDLRFKSLDEFCLKTLNLSRTSFKPSDALCF